MSKKSKTSSVDFDFGVGLVIPSTQEAYKETFQGEIRREEKEKLASFKDIIGKDLDQRLKANPQFPVNCEVFLFIVQYFVSETEYACRDIDNMAKTILDLLKARFYKDDSQVKTLLVGKKIEKRVPQNFAYVAIKELRSGQDVDALKSSGLERSVTMFQELKSKGIL